MAGVRTEIAQPRGASNYAPTLRISWDAAKLGATGSQVADTLLSGEPRIIVTGNESGVTVMPYMMMPDDDRIAAKRLHEVLSNPPRRQEQPTASGGTSVAGQWDVEIEFVRGAARHTLYLEDRDGKLMGQHRGDLLSGDLRGARDGERVNFRSSHRYEGTSLGYRFDGVVRDGAITGTVDLGEYGKAKFTAKRHWA